MLSFRCTGALGARGYRGCRGFRSSSANQSRIYESILDTVGSTPIVRVNNIGPPGVNLFVKCEFFNPLGSVKDRLAMAMIEV
jgi:cysteine synthase A